MKITKDILQQFTGGNFSEITILDLSSLRLDRIDNLEDFTALETLILSNNCIHSINSDSRLKENIELWNIDLSRNRISSLEGLITSSRLIGHLKLNNNHLTLGELVKLREITIIELDVYGNPQIEQYEFARKLIIDLMPNVWILDGRFITQRERDMAKAFFIDKPNNPIRDEIVHQLHKRHPLSFPVQILGLRHRHFLERFHAAPEITDNEKLLYLIEHYTDNYLLAKSLPPKAFASRKQNRIQSDAPFYLSILSRFPAIPNNCFRTYLEATILFNFSRRIQEESLTHIFNQVVVELSLDQELISQIIIDITSLPSFSKRGLLSYLFNDPFIEERSKTLIVTSMYQLVKICNHFSDPSDRSVMRSFLSSVKEITGRSRSTTPASSSNPSRSSPGMSQKGDCSKGVDPLIKMEDPHKNSTEGYWHLRVPKPGEAVRMDGHVFTLISVLTSGFALINKENEEGGCVSVPISRLRWIPRSTAGYWRFYPDTSPPRSIRVMNHILKRSDASIFTANETWTSDFFLASQDYIEVENLKRPKGLPPKWSKIDDVVPFKVFEIPYEEFVVTLPPRKPRQESYDHYSNTNNSSENNRQALTHVEEDTGDNTFLTTVPLGEERQETATADSRTTMLPFIDTSTNYVATTSGGMNISVPERLVEMASRSESMQYLPDFCKRKKKKNWEVVPGKPACIVANPLQRHPFTFPKERLPTKLVEQPMYTKSMYVIPKLCASSIHINSDITFKANDLFRPTKKLSNYRVNGRGVSTKQTMLAPLANQDFVMCATSAPLFSSRSSLCSEPVLDKD